MTKYFLYIALLLSLTFLPAANSQEVNYIAIAELDNILKNNEDKIHVVNFWATWCGPCVREFPLFEKVSKDYSGKNVKFLMISLDFPSQVKSQLIPFLEKNKTSLEIAVMTDLDYNAWIEKVDKSWQGDIPVTLVFNNARKQRNFHKGEIDEQELRKLINNYL